jgi:hypothetical protein
MQATGRDEEGMRNDACQSVFPLAKGGGGQHHWPGQEKVGGARIYQATDHVDSCFLVCVSCFAKVCALSVDATPNFWLMMRQLW